MEATGCNRNPDIARLRRIGDYLHEQGFEPALDDVGDNAEALRLICDVRPGTQLPCAGSPTYV
jgi:EAL domain-containing protein (putative c-di-GMP-specific phosphodiesterase class I)